MMQDLTRPPANEFIYLSDFPARSTIQADNFLMIIFFQQRETNLMVEKMTSQMLSKVQTQKWVFRTQLCTTYWTILDWDVHVEVAKLHGFEEKSSNS